MQTLTSESALADFDVARDEYLAAIRQVPAAGLGYLKPGDDYTLGGLAVHVTFVLEHYRNVLNALLAAGFTECRPRDPEGLEAGALGRAGSALRTDDVEGELAATMRLHDEARGIVQRLDEDRARKAAVWYPGAAEPHPTSAADVLGWLTGHYREHVPHIESLLAEWRATGGGALDVVHHFNEAFARGDVDAVMDLMTEECVFESTYPPPDGERCSGQAAVRDFWERFFGSTDTPIFTTEEIFAADDRVVCRWRFEWGRPESGGHVRGVDVFRVRGGKVAEKLAYVKG